MKLKVNKIIKNTGMLLLLATIVTFNLIIGANEKGLRVLPISILMAAIVIYLIVVKIKNKDKSIIFKSKADYFVLVFMLTTTLPLVFRTYVSYSDTVEFIMKYFFIFTVYLLARNVIKDQKQIECVIITTLISSLIPIFLHIDFLNKQFLFGFMKWLRITYDKGSNFSSTFGYANAQAIYSAFGIFLAMHRFQINKNKILKTLDLIYILFSLCIIWLAEAQTIMLLMGIACFILLIIKYKNIIMKNKKKSIIGVIALLCLITAYLNIALNTSKPIVEKNEDVSVRIYNRYKQYETYTIELEYEIECLNKTREGEQLKVDISQFGKYFNEKIIEKAEIDTLSNKFKIEVKPTKDTKYIKLKIYNGYYGIIKINNCYVNGERQIVNYKYIPNKIGVLFNKFLTRGKSLEQRGYMYNDCLKIAKDSPIIGNGGNTWRVVSRAVSEYKGALKESHSYFFELLISYGIIGVIAFLSFVIYFFITIFKQCKKDKEKRKNKILIAIGLFILLLHSITFDFNMSFMLIQLVVYIYMAVLLYDEQEECKKHKVIDLFVLLFLVFILSIYIRADISRYLLQDYNTKHIVTPYEKDNYSKKINKDIDNGIETKIVLKELKDFMRKEPYYEQTKSYEKYFNQICESLAVLSNAELNEYLNFGTERLQTVKFKTPMYLDTIFDRVDVLVNTVNSLKNYAIEENKKEKVNQDEERITIINNSINKLKDIINKEYEINIKNIEDEQNGNYSSEARNNMKQKYEKIIEALK